MPKKPQKSDSEQKDFQEQKNYLDFVYQTNTQIQALNHAIIDLGLTVDKIRAKGESDHKALLIDCENFKSDIATRCKSVESRMGDLETSQNSNLSKINQDLNQLSNTTIKAQMFHEVAHEHHDQIKRLEEAVVNCRACNASAINLMGASHSCRIDSLRDELVALIPKSFPFEAQIEEKMRIFKQDFDSLFHETTNLKLAFASVQKKFEHVCRIELQQEVNK